MAALAWRAEKVKSFFSGKSSLLTRESARVAQTTTYFDNSKICSGPAHFNIYSTG